MNYQELIMTVKSYTENDFPSFLATDGSTFTGLEQLAVFVTQAEERIYNAVQIPAIRRNVLGNMLAGDKYLSLPVDFLAMFSFAIIGEDGTHTYLLNKDVSFIREAYPNQNLTDMPKHYAQFDQNSLIFGPSPDQSYTVEMHYYYYPVSIVTAGTSWLGDNFSSVLLYGTLVEAYTFMKGDADMLAQYTKQFMEAMGLLKQLGDGKNRRDAYRSGQLRIPVQ